MTKLAEPGWPCSASAPWSEFIVRLLSWTTTSLNPAPPLTVVVVPACVPCTPITLLPAPAFRVRLATPLAVTAGPPQEMLPPLRVYVRSAVLPWSLTRSASAPLPLIVTGPRMLLRT
jgi:hypothetical protein